MLSSEELWRRVHVAFEPHRKLPGDIDAQAALERVAKKCLGLAETKPFNVSNSSIREEMMTAEMLDHLIVYHSRTAPLRDGGLLVILRYGGHNVVIDGNNRVNLWRAQKKPGPFHAIVIEPNENAA